MDLVVVEGVEAVGKRREGWVGMIDSAAGAGACSSRLPQSWGPFSRRQGLREARSSATPAPGRLLCRRPSSPASERAKISTG